MQKSKLPVQEDLDFHYVLGLMPPLHDIPEFAWLPELFSIVGHRPLIKLCKYAGGESITIPTLEQLVQSIEALQWYYNVFGKKTHSYDEIPAEHLKLTMRIKELFDAGKC